MDRFINGLDGWMNRWVDRSMMSRWMDACVDRWMDVCVDGWMDG
jgi:hypothetical protein